MIRTLLLVTVAVALANCQYAPKVAPYPPKAPTGPYPAKVPTAPYPPKVPTAPYPPKVPTAPYPPKAPTAPYPPKAPTAPYPPKAPTAPYPAKVPTGPYPAKAPTGPYPAKVTAAVTSEYTYVPEDHKYVQPNPSQYAVPAQQQPYAPKIVPAAPAPVYGPPPSTPSKPVETAYEYKLVQPAPTPAKVYGAPEPQKPAAVYGVPEHQVKVYVPQHAPAPVYGPPPTTKTVYAPIASVYEYKIPAAPKPAAVYGPPPSAPLKAYGPPAAVYGPPIVVEAKPVKTEYEYKIPATQKPAAVYGPPAKVYGPPAQAYVERPAAPAPVYGPPQPAPSAAAVVHSAYEYKVVPQPKYEPVVQPHAVYGVPA